MHFIIDGCVAFEMRVDFLNSEGLLYHLMLMLFLISIPKKAMKFQTLFTIIDFFFDSCFSKFL